MQLPSAAENSVSDTSIAVICGLADFDTGELSSRHRSESAARAADAALSSGDRDRTQKNGMAAQDGLSRCRQSLTGMLLRCSRSRMARRPAFAKKARPLHARAQRRVIGRRCLPPSGMARKVMVAGANVTVPAAVGTPAIVGSSSPAASASVPPFSLTSRPASSRHPACNAPTLSEASARAAHCGRC